MAGLPWLVVFGLIAAIAMWRGWGWVSVVALLCVGISLGDTTIGSGFYHGTQNLIANVWGGIVSALNSVAR